MSTLIRSAVTVSLVEESRGGPFVFWHDLAAACRNASQLGFDAIEIFASSARELNLTEVRRLTDDYGLKVAAVGSGAGWIKHKLRLTDPDTGIRARACEFISELIDAGGELDAPVIIGSMQGRWGDGVSREQALGWLAESLCQLAARARKSAQPLFYEALNRYETNLLVRQEDAAAFLRALEADNIQLLCDLFHMNIEERSIPDALRAVSSQIGHVHLADSNRQAMGFGHIDVGPIADVLREVNYSGCLSAECLPLPDSQAAAEQTLRSFRQWFR
jgi:sugar phosphate isomerase/epimerase